MKAIKIIFFLLKGLFVLTQLSIGQQSFFNINELQHKKTVEIRIPIDTLRSHNSYRIELLENLIDSGYFDVKLDSTFRQEDHETYQFTLGERYRLSEVIFESIDDTLRLNRDEYFDVSSIKSIIQTQLIADEQNGYPYSSISISSIEKFNLNKVNVYFHHEMGELIEIEGLYFSGNRQLSDQFLTKLTRFQSNSIFSPSIYNDIEISLRNSLFIQDVTQLGVIKQRNEYMFGYNVIETRSSSLDLVVGYEPDAVTGNKFVGNGSLRLINLFSEGSLAWMEFQKLTGSDSRLNFEYDQFWYNNIPLQMGVRLWFTQRDSSYQMISTKYSSSISIGDYYSIGAFLGYNSTRGVNSNLTTSTINNSEIEGGVNLEISDLDRRISPTNGFNLNLELSTGIKKLKSNLSHPYPRSRFIKHSITLNSQIYKRLSDQLVYTTSINSSYLDMDQYFEDDLYIFGGTKSLRGYREEQFRSSSLVWGDSELRYLLDDVSFLFIFGAIGYHQYPTDYNFDDQRQDSQMLYSSGFGLNYRIRLGLLKLTYAVGSQDQIMNGKVHFGITNFF